MARLKNLAPRVASLPSQLRPPPKIAESFYTSVAWRSLVASIKRQRGAQCEQCGSRRRIIGDHIVERRDGGGDLAPSNVMLLCFTCHQRKTAKARARRARGEV